MRVIHRAHSALSRLIKGVLMLVERPNAIPALITWSHFSVTSFRMVDDLRRQGILPATVIDIGANVGQFTCAALKLLHPQILHAFEPLPEAVRALRQAFGNKPNVIIHGVALGDAAAELSLHVNAHGHASSVLKLGEAHRLAFPEAAEVGSVMVPVRTLDGELAAAELFEPMLVKLDVQGYERWVHNGAEATLGRARWVILELSFRPMYEGESSFLDMVAYMSTRGFRLLRPVGWLAAPNSGEIVQCDALFNRV